MYEPFPPTLNSYREYERGSDLLILKNEEDPQANIMMAMGRGAGRTFGKPFGFYWEQTHYPFPSLDEKLHVCLLYYLSGGSWIGAEADDAPSFANDIVADWVYPLVQALRFAMVHPARGSPIVPVGIVYSAGDTWWVPYNPFGQMDTFQRYIEYDHATNKLTCEPSFTKVFPWMPQEGPKWNWRQFGHLALFIDQARRVAGLQPAGRVLPEVRRRLHGPHHPPADRHALRPGGLRAPGPRHGGTSQDVRRAGRVGQGHGAAGDRGQAHRGRPQRCAGDRRCAALPQLARQRGRQALRPQLSQRQHAKCSGQVTGMPEISRGKTGNYSGALFSAQGDGWETVASVGDRPLVLRKPLGKGMVYVYLGRWMWQGADALRPRAGLRGPAGGPAGASTSPTTNWSTSPTGRTAGPGWPCSTTANIVVGCDRLDPAKWRVAPPEPLCTTPRGPYRGTIEFRLDKLGLDPQGDYALYQVLGIDGKALDGVVSGRKTFEVKDTGLESKGGAIQAAVESTSGPST